uniref:TPd superfamily protein n=1 Tax=Borely moumouvirus TaxID=2712067 RepID=A0A6G6ABR4_9VIRU
MKKLVWNNVKIYTPQTINQRIFFIKKVMKSTMPLYGKEQKILVKYADKNNLPHDEIISLRNSLKIQNDINKAQNYKIKLSDLKKKFTDIVEKNYDSENFNNKIEKFIKSSDISIDIVLKVINKTYHYKKYNLDKLPFIKILNETLIKKNQEQKIKSRQFEICLENYLTEKNIPYLAEKDIIENNIHNLTPDILFESPITIVLNGSEYIIHWMDAKNYTLTKIPYILKSVKKQASKYYNAFGLGALVFHYGYDNTINIPGAIILDGSFMDLQ